MVPQTLQYLGQLRCQATHSPSKSQFITDAPVDNHGRGESFSPTDLVVTALASCVVTTMGIAAENDHVSLEGTKAYAEKHMSTDTPRRIVRIVLRVDFPGGIPASYRSHLEHIAHTCPVQKSIHPDIAVDLELRYPD
jgi:putative redox protein